MNRGLTSTFTSTSSIFGKGGYSAGCQKRKVNNNPTKNSFIYSDV